MQVTIHQQEIKVNLKHRENLKLFIAEIFKREKRAAESLAVIFCSDAFLLRMNNQFLDHNYYTDILTFNLGETTGAVAGELYISIDRVKDNASRMGSGINSELHRVIFHGCLHLCGYADKTPKETALMRNKEDFYLERYMTF